MYKFSFTATSLRTKDLIKLINWTDSYEDLILRIGNGKRTTGKRIVVELEKWVKVLTPEQKEILMNGSFKAQNEIAFLAVCKYYAFIREFIIEVAREKYLVYDYEITEGDYLSFFRKKALINNEIERLTEKTQNKIKQVIFKILEQASIIDTVKHKRIQPQLLEEEVQKAIINENIEYLKFFLYSDHSISQIIEVYERYK